MGYADKIFDLTGKVVAVTLPSLPEIIGAALFPAWDASSCTSGTVIRLDGGMF
jgi:hypothetical protein